MANLSSFGKSLAFATATSCVALSSAEARELNIQSQPLSQALMVLAAQSDVAIVAPSRLTNEKQAHSVSGNMRPKQALAQMLVGTGLYFEEDQGGSLVLTADASGYRAVDVAETDANRAQYEETVKTGAQSSRLEEVTDNDFMFEEIIVTATKRATNIQDTSMSITAIGAQSISERNLVGMEDYLHAVPGVNLMNQGAAYNSIVIRGLAINAEQDGDANGPVTGVYFGDTPISGLGVSGNSADIKLVDMERVEVLKGPQGTLYGAGAMGGVVRNIPKEPDLAEFSGSVKVGVSNTARLGGTNSDVQAVINLPIVEDKLAVRAVAYHFDNSGYYRNIAAREAVMAEAADTFGGVAITNDDIGASTYTGGRVSAKWKPTENFTLGLNYLYQEIDQVGWAQTDIGVGGSYDQSRLQVREGTSTADVTRPRANEGFEDQLSIMQASLEYDFGWATLSSVTSIVNEETLWRRDGALFFSPAMPYSQNIYNTGDNTTEELRLNSQFDEPLQFIAGYYYEDRDAGFHAFNVYGGSEALFPGGFHDIVLEPTRGLKHHALFGEVTYDVSEQLSVLFGARAFDQKRTYEVFRQVNAGASTITAYDASANDVSFKAGVDFKPTDDTLLYASWSQGFRLGDVRAPVTEDLLATCDANGDGFYDDFPNVPVDASFLDSDTVDNYELGGKATMLDGRLRMNAAVYQIDWKNIPVTFSTCGVGINLNAGSARSRGVEFDTTYMSASGVSVDLAASYVDAELVGASDQLVGVGKPGDRLPGSPKYTFSAGLQYDFEIAGKLAYVRGDYSYVGGFYVDLAEERNKLGDYGKVDINMGIQIDRFDLSIFAHNLTNEDNLTSESFFFAPRGSRLRPRTVGLKLGYNF